MDCWLCYECTNITEEKAVKDAKTQLNDALIASWAVLTLPRARCLRCDHFRLALFLLVPAGVTVYNFSDLALFGLKFELLVTR